jgi:YD repeat-containing protein
MVGEVASRQRWMMTTEAHTQLVDELAQLRGEIASLAGQGLEEGIVRLPIAQAARRLRTLTSVVDAATITEMRCGAIGRRVEARDADGNLMQCTIVFPGDGDPAKGFVSADSPLGAALLGAQPGATVLVDAPAGQWRATVVDVT